MNITSVASQAREQIKSRRFSLPLPISILIVIALLALGVRLATFERYLPYFDYGDEQNMYLLARAWWGVEIDPVVPQWLAGYPPLYVWVNMGVQQVVTAHWSRPWILAPEYFYYTRLLAVGLGFLTTLALMRIGWLLGGFVGAAFAGSIWAFTPLVVDYNSLALPDPLVYLVCAIALLGAFEAWRRKSPVWLTVSLLGGIAATYTKYPAVFALIPWGVVGLALLIRQPRRWLPWLVLHGIFGMATAAYLLFGYGALNLDNREAGSVRNAGIAPMLDFGTQSNNWFYAILPIGTVLFFSVVIVGIAAYYISRRRGWQTISWGSLLLILLYGIVGISITTTFTVIGIRGGKIRHALPITIGLIGLWAANVAQIYWTLRDWYGTRPRTRLRRLPQGVALGFAVLVAIPLAVGSIHSIQTFHLRSTVLMAQEYGNDSLPADGRILMVSNQAELNAIYNRNWGGYIGKTTFDWWFQNPVGSTPEDFAKRGITYFLISTEDWERAKDPAGLKQFVDQLTLLGTIKPGEGEIGTEIHFYRMLPPQVTTQVRFGDQIRLEGYDLTSAEVHPGESLTFRPYWRALSTPPLNYSMFVHIYPGDELRVITQYDGTPALPARLTLTWSDPEELIIGSDVTLTIPPETPLGDYVIALGLYDFASGQRLTTSAPQDDKFEIPIKVVGS